MNEPRRLGRFSIPRVVIEHQPDLARAVTAGLLILECNYRADEDAFSYLAIGDAFDFVAPFQYAPRYRARFMTVDKGEGAKPRCVQVFEGWDHA